MEVKNTEQVTAEGTNAGGDEIEAAGKKDTDGIATKEADATTIIAELVDKARAAMDVFIDYDQEQVNEVVQAVAWAIIKQENAEELARLVWGGESSFELLADASVAALDGRDG